MEEMYIQRRKVHSAAWKFTFFSILSIVGCYILLTENWALDPPSFFRNWPDVPMSSLMRFYYNLELAGYLYTLLLMPFEPKQTALDIIALLIHHGSTIFLLWNSYIFSLHRIGIIIATLHDVSDPFMELAKLILYSGRNKLADAFFGMFAAIFIITRNFIFPLYAINSTFIYMKREDGTYFPTETFYFTLLSALWVLEVLHVYWSYLILKMVRKALSEKGVSDDIRNTEVVDHEKEE
ncbi:TRAM/LAG1/CLN8 homology domain-containing protein [Globomyces pollinis-pini]|nr:TRAM/LAG1/CLN8 homology domain-containing protein [Globomyces pollinis-pini]